MQCELFLANSTIPGAGLGVFAGVPLHAHGTVGTYDMFLPIIDIYWHDKLQLPQDGYTTAFDDYVWDGKFMGMGMESHGPTPDFPYKQVISYGAGLNSALNCHLGVINVRSTSTYVDDCGLHRKKDPGAGAFSPYKSGLVQTTHAVPQGGELFVDYGDGWFIYRNKVLGLIPLSKDYPIANDLVQKYSDLFQNDHGQQPLPPPAQQHLEQSEKQVQQLASNLDMQEDLWEILTHFPFESRALNAIPKDFAKLPLITNLKEENVSRTTSGSVEARRSTRRFTRRFTPRGDPRNNWGRVARRAKHQMREGKQVTSIRSNVRPAHQLDFIRPIEELIRTGRCFDSITSDRSTIDQAGYGAFAKSSIPAGQIITGSPLLYIVDGLESLKMFQGDWFAKDQNDLDRTKVKTYQILMNYCYGHPQSTMLLCPYGAGVNLINHNQTLANVKIQWSPQGILSHDDAFLAKTVEEILRMGKVKPHAAIDYVALRDIQPGEELFLDYGDLWEHAWQRHVESFHSQRPTRNAQLYRTARQFNHEHEQNRQSYHFLRTVQEQEINPYPYNLELRCHSMIFYTATEAGKEETVSLDDFVWADRDKGEPCQITHREEIVLDEPDQREDGTIIEKLYRYKIKRTDDGSEYYGIPREGIIFADKPYTTDLHLEGVFRHPLIFPDEMFPQTWRNSV